MFKFKIVLFALLGVAYGAAWSVFQRVYAPGVVNPIAMKQFEDTPQSFTGIASYNLFVGLYPYGWLLLVLIAVWAFWGDIKRAVKKVEEVA